MKGVTKIWIRNLSFAVVCFSLFAIFSLAINTKGVSALRHDVNYIPLSTDGSLIGGQVAAGSSWVGNPPVQLYWNGDYAPDTSHVPSPLYYYARTNDYDGPCFVPGLNTGDQKLGFAVEFGSYNLSIGFNSISYFESNRFSDSANLTNFQFYGCRQLAKFGELLPEFFSDIRYHPNFDESSLVNINLNWRPLFLSFKQYYYEYDSAYLHDSVVDTDSGMHYTSSLKMSELFGFVPNKFNRMVLPLGRSNSDVGAIYQNRKVSFKGVFDFSGQGNTFTWHPDLTNSHFRLYINGIYNHFQGYRTAALDYTDCSTNFVSLEANYHYQLEFTCDYFSPYDFEENQTWFYLSMGNPEYLFDTNADWSFSTSYFVTDNDSTPGATWGTEPTGEHLENAPGKATIDNSSDEDFFSSLKNMFTFNFVNPFATIFELFSDNNSCAQIPVIAGMIHSEESQVCPWFSSEVRNIVTPVLGIASMMLIFGFAVRWLGSSSGNMFEDSANETVSNVNHSGWRRYKK